MSVVWAGWLFSFTALSNTCAFWLPWVDLLTFNTRPGTGLQETICWWGVSRDKIQLAFTFTALINCAAWSKWIITNSSHLTIHIDDLNREPNLLNKKGSFLHKALSQPSLTYNTLIGKVLYTVNKIFRQPEIAGMSWWSDS